MQIIIEGCRYPAGTVDIVRLPDPISCRGDVGMWTLGADIVRLEKNQPWGSKFMQRVSADLKTWNAGGEVLFCAESSIYATVCFNIWGF